MPFDASCFLSSSQLDARDPLRVGRDQAAVGAEAEPLGAVGAVAHVVAGAEPRDLLLGEEVARRDHGDRGHEREDALLGDEPSRFRERGVRVVVVVGEFLVVEGVALHFLVLVRGLEAGRRAHTRIGEVLREPHPGDRDRPAGCGGHAWRTGTGRGHEQRGDEPRDDGGRRARHRRRASSSTVACSPLGSRPSRTGKFYIICGPASVQAVQPPLGGTTGDCHVRQRSAGARADRRADVEPVGHHRPLRRHHRPQPAELRRARRARCSGSSDRTVRARRRSST